jgi:hypothetical protein
MAPDGSSWGYTDPLGQTWWACSYAEVPRQTTPQHLLRYGAYAGWDLQEHSFTDPDGIVAHRHQKMAQKAAEARND